MESLTLRVNGQIHRVTAPANTPLLYLLRNDLGLKGARYGCGIGECGACSVLLDGVRVASCDTPAWAAEGKAITTIEGLGQPEALHPLQQAFLDEQAFQCGYCITGILIAAKALLDQHPDPSDAQIRSALDGNLCRCGTHHRILRAVRRAARQMRQATP